ncbi:MAG: SRPBCC family protein [Actinomycetes bacterium]
MTAERPRAEIVTTDSSWKRSGRILIEAPVNVIFDILADPRMHAEFDGSGTVQRQINGPQRLSKGATFGMAMRVKFPYTITNTVEEFEEPTRIAWRHLGRHRWRYELEALDESSTMVTETFDGSTALFPPALKLINAYENNQKAILKSLVRLKALAEDHARHV